LSFGFTAKQNISSSKCKLHRSYKSLKEEHWTGYWPHCQKKEHYIEYWFQCLTLRKEHSMDWILIP
jgi:hypothetical protein